MKICAIHQPNFFPWLGYFDKIKKADVFVFLDQVDYPKSGNSMGSWCNRVKLNVGGKATWVSCPVIREHGRQPIDTVRINNQSPWRDALRKILIANYRGAPNFPEAFALVESLLAYQTDRLAEFNIYVIRELAKYLGYRTAWVAQSSLPSMSEKATDRLVAICRAVGADTYLCGGGSSEYLETEVFARAGVNLVYQDFIPEPYGEAQQFIPGLSIIDWLMHERAVHGSRGSCATAH